MREIPEGLPFDDEVIYGAAYGKERIAELKNRPDKIIKKYPFHLTSREEWKKDKDFVKDYCEKYGIRVPNYDVIFAKDEEGEAVGFVMMDKIEGEDLDSIENLPKEAREELDKLYAGLTDSYVDAFQSNGYYLHDIDLGGFVYGRKHGEKEDNFYYVDPEPSKMKFEGITDFLDGVVVLIADYVKDLEAKFKPPARLTETRRHLGKVLEIARNHSLDKEGQALARDLENFLRS